MQKPNRRPSSHRLRALRPLRAQFHDALVLFREFRYSLFLFLALLVFGTLMFWQFYTHPETHERINLNRAFFAAFSLVFFQTGNVPYPDDALLIDVLYYLMPIVGLGLIGNSLVRFGVQIFNKESRREEWDMALASTYHGHVVVCGTGRVGYRVIEQLIKFDEDVVAIENNAQHPFIQRVRDELKVPVIVADARRPDVLRQAGVTEATAILPCTDNDLSNLEIALNARELNPRIRVVMRLFEPELAEKISKAFGLDVAFSTSALAAPAFAAAVHQQDIRQALYIDDMLMALSPVDIGEGSRLIGQTLGEIEQTFDVNLVLHKRNGKVDHRPDHQIRLQTRDHVIIFGRLDGLERVKQANQNKGK